MRDDKPTKEDYERWSKDPSNWVWGAFYYNKKDKRLFPPKRIPIFGWTINFANPLSVLVMLLIIVLVIVVLEVLTWL